MKAPSALPGNGAETFKIHEFQVAIPGMTAGQAPGTQWSSAYEISGYKIIGILSIGLTDAGNKKALISYSIDQANHKVGVNYKNIATSSVDSTSCKVKCLYARSDLF